MKVLFVMLVAAGIVWYFGFYSKDALFHDYSNDSGYFLGRQICPDLKPKNPYAPLSSEYEGFSWGEAHPGEACQSALEQFNMGCLEHQRQASAYANCTKNP